MKRSDHIKVKVFICKMLSISSRKENDLWTVWSRIRITVDNTLKIPRSQ